MELVKETLANGNTITYKIVNGTAYHAETSDIVIKILENARLNGTRILLDYGDNSTGRSWAEYYDIRGRVGRSTGSIKIPILLNNGRCVGGGAILDHCIVAISYSNKKEGGRLYSHPTYHKKAA